MKRSPVHLSGQPYGTSVFDRLFSKARSSLYLIAHRILGEASMADRAVDRCRRTAANVRARFECEGECHSWLLRILIDEALAILVQSQVNQAAIAQGHVDQIRSHDDKWRCYHVARTLSLRMPLGTIVPSEKGRGARA